jgi:HEPN domain-containing protein
MIASIRNSQVRKLCTLAAGDEAALQFPLHDEIYGFHVQQSCEKLLKALIAAHNQLYPFTHNLVDLAKLLAQNGELLLPLPCAWVSIEPYGVLMRYDYGPALSDSERKDMRETVEMLRDHVIERILQLERGVTP